MRKYVIILLGLIGGLTTASAQPYFNKVTGPFTAVANGQTKWADMDSDKDLDLILTGTDAGGTPRTLVYENISGTFTLHPTALPNIHQGSMAMGDYDNDGDTDILISGSTSAVSNATVSAIFRNDGGFVFTQQFTFTGLSHSFVAWLDPDMDDDLDFIMTGANGNIMSAPLTLYYENTGSGFNQILNGNIPNCLDCNFDVADGNGDGKPDIIMTGKTESALYLGNGDKTFTKDVNQFIRQISTGVARWGDFDADGDVDFLLTGTDAFNNYSTFIYNNIHGTFFERGDIELLATAVNSRNGAIWLDHNNDGRLDLLVTGRTNIEGLSHRLYENYGGGVFLEIIESAIDPMDDMSFDVGDFDNDGDVDISFLGISGASTPVAGYFQNTLISGAPTVNTKPQPPSPGTFSEHGFRKEVRLDWDAATDAETPGSGLSYNFYLRVGANKVIHPAVDFSNGYVKTTNPQNGFGRHGFAANLPEGNIYYAVQSVDGGRAGSNFSAEKLFFHFNGPENVSIDIVDDTNVTLNWSDNSGVETNFNIARSNSPITGFATVGTVAADVLTVNDNFTFLTETNYYYRVNAYNASFTSPYDSMTLLIPERPINLSATALGGYSIQLNWQDQSTHEVGFVIERKLSTGSFFSTIWVASPNASSYVDHGVQPGKTYDYQIKSISNNGGLPPIQIASASTNHIPVGVDFQINSPEDNQVVIAATDFTSKYSDADGDPLDRIVIVQLPEHGVLALSGVPTFAGQEITTSNLDFLTFDPDPDFSGITGFYVYPSDGIDFSPNVWTCVLNIQPVNDQPTFTLASVLNLNEDFGSAQLTPVLATNPYESGDVITYSITPGTASFMGVAINPSTGVVSLTSLQDQYGQITFTITVDDGQAVNNTFSKDVTVTVLSVNDPPVLGEIADISVDLAIGPTVAPIVITATDVETVLDATMFQGTSSNGLVLHDDKITFTTGLAGEFLLNLAPQPVIGTTTVTVIVSDGFVNRTTTFKLTMFLVTGLEAASNVKVSVFPNPVNEKLVISLGAEPKQASYVLRDMLGHELVSRSIEGSSAEVSTVALSPGLYILDLQVDGVGMKKKIVKQ